MLISASLLKAQRYTWTKVSGGGEFSIALRSDGTLWSWGRNYSGQLGIKAAGNQLVPVKIGNDSNWADIEAGANHCIALKSDGTLWVWGDNRYGQLGVGSTTTNAESPVKVGSDDDWKSLAVGNNTSFAIKTNGSLWGWGSNWYGTVGNNTSTNNQFLPTQIGNETNWRRISVGVDHTMAIKTDGTLWAWGNNDYGQLGNGKITPSGLPIQIGTDNDWDDIGAGFGFSIGMKKNRSIWSWGAGSGWQLGQPDSTTYYNPNQVGTDTNWRKIAVGTSHVFAITMDSALYRWGVNSHWMLGSNMQFVKQPTRLGSENNWHDIMTADPSISSLEAAGYHAFGFKGSNEVLCVIGANSFGQLGINSKLDSKEFVCSVNANGLITSTLINSKELANQITIFPNPSEGTFNILLPENKHQEPIKIRFINATGQTVISESAIPAVSNIQFDLQKYPKGIYLMEINLDQNRVLKKIVLR